MEKAVTKILALLLIVVLAAGVSSCTAGKDETKIPDGTQTQENTENKNGAGSSSEAIEKEFDVIQDESDLPEEVQDAVNELKDKRGYTWFKTGDEYIVVIFSGEKNTGGYGIDVTDVSEIDGTVRITVEETAPGEDEMVIMVITYPWIAVRFESDTENFLVEGKDGEVFEELEYSGGSEDAPEEITIKAEYVGEIDGSSIAANVDGEEMAFRHERVQELLDVVNVLKPGDIITLVYYTNEYGQNMIVKIELSK